MADSIKKYLDMVALETLVDQIKAEDTKTLNAAKGYADGLGKNYDAAGAATTAKAEAIAAAKTETETQVNALANGQVKANTEAIATIKDSTTIDSFADVETALAGKQAAGDYATKAEAKGYADAKDTAIQAAQNAANANAEAITAINNPESGILAQAKGHTNTEVGKVQTAVDTLAGKVGTVPEGSTVMGIIENIQENAYDDTEIQGKINDVSSKVTTLIGDDANKSVRTIANEELVKQLITEDAAESLDTLAEIAAWIQDHPSDAAAMNQAITALQNKVVLGTDAEGNEYATVKAYVEAAIAALKIGDYAKAADLTALAGRVTTLENKPFDTYATKTEVQTVDVKFANYTTTTDMNTALDKKADKTQVATDIANAIAPLATTESVNTKLADYTKTADLDTTLGLTTKLAAKVDKTVVDAMYTNAKIDELVQGAKTHATGLNNAMNTRVEALEDHFEGETNVLTRLTAVEASANANAAAIAKFTAITADEVNALFA